VIVTRITAEAQLGECKVTQATTANKIRPQEFSQSHTHFSEQLICMIKKSRAKHKKNEKNVSL
jgi:hypothetical protein